MKTLAFIAVVLVGMCGWAKNSSQSGTKKSGINHELQQATQILHQMTGPNATAGIPEAVLENAKCIAIVPNMIQAGFIVGGRHGAGVATCKTGNNTWSPPAPFSLSGGSFGAQIGGQSVDLIMMVMNSQGMKGLRSGHFKVGGEVSAAAGPVGRQASASAGWKAGILTYSRTKGAYAGATVKGAELQQDNSATKALYGHNVPFNQILNGKAAAPSNPQVQSFLSAIRQAEQTAQAR